MLVPWSRAGFALALFSACLLAADSPRTTDPPAGSPSASGDKDTPSVTAEHSHRVHLGGISVGAGYTHFSRPFYYGWPGYGYYDPFWYPMYSPYFYSPYYFTGFARGPNMGEIKLRTEQRSAEVFLDGAYAGVASDLKNIWLDPGAYDLEVRAPNRQPFNRRIYVLSGKTLRIEAALKPAAGEVKP
jgi:hypothetical protein